MEIENLQSWEEFESEANNLFQQQTRFGPKLLFRGQADANCHLKTTLERHVGAKYALMDYYQLIHQVESMIETFTDMRWEKMPNLKTIADWWEGYDPVGYSFGKLGNIPAYDYMIYLRHHGFPSPLLDWSKSLYVASYFAFRDVLSNAKEVAIFALIENYGPEVALDVNGNILRLGSYIRTDKRHFHQQSDYTLCIKRENDLTFTMSHEGAFATENATGQLLRKFILPSSEREKALKKLDMYNINAYSLFGSEESLMETLFLREYVIGDSRFFSRLPIEKQ